MLRTRSDDASRIFGLWLAESELGKTGAGWRTDRAVAVRETRDATGPGGSTGGVGEIGAVAGVGAGERSFLLCT